MLSRKLDRGDIQLCFTSPWNSWSPEPAPLSISSYSCPKATLNLTLKSLKVPPEERGYPLAPLEYSRVCHGLPGIICNIKSTTLK